MVVSIKKCIFAADVALREKSSDSIFSDKLRFIYLSLPFFDKSSEEQEKYDESIKAVDDYYSGLYGSYIEGEEKGIAKGRVEVARNLLSMGMSWSQIMQATGLTEEQLKQLH